MNNKTDHDEHFIFSNEWNEITYKHQEKDLINKNNELNNNINDMDFFFDNFENNNEKLYDKKLQNGKINSETIVNTFNDSLWLESDNSIISVNKESKEHNHSTKKHDNSYELNVNTNTTDNFEFNIDKKVDVNSKLDLWESNNNQSSDNNIAEEKKTNFYNYMFNAETLDPDMFANIENSVTITDKKNLKLNPPDYIFNEFDINNQVCNENIAFNDNSFDTNFFQNDTCNNTNKKDTSSNEQNKIYNNKANEIEKEATKSMNTENNNEKKNNLKYICKKNVNDAFINNDINLDVDTRSGASDKTYNGSSANNCSTYIHNSNNDYSFDNNLISKHLNNNDEAINTCNNHENSEYNKNEKKNITANSSSKDKMNIKKTKKCVSKKIINSNSSLESSTNTLNSSISDEKGAKLKKKKKIKSNYSDTLANPQTTSDNLDETKSTSGRKKISKIKDINETLINNNAEEKKIKIKKKKNYTSSDENILDTIKGSDEKIFFNEIKEYLNNKNTREIDTNKINENNTSYDTDIKNKYSKEKIKIAKKQLSSSKELSSKEKIKKKEKKPLLKQNNVSTQKTPEKQKSGEKKSKKASTNNIREITLTKGKDSLNIKSECTHLEDMEITNYFENNNEKENNIYNTIHEEDILEEKKNAETTNNLHNSEIVTSHSINHSNKSFKSKNELSFECDIAFNDIDSFNEINHKDYSKEIKKKVKSSDQIKEKSNVNVINEDFVGKTRKKKLYKSSSSYSENIHFLEENYRKKLAESQKESQKEKGKEKKKKIEMKSLEKEREMKNVCNENEIDINYTEKDGGNNIFVKQLKQENEKSKYIENDQILLQEEIIKNRDVKQNERIKEIEEIKKTEEMEKFEEIKEVKKTEQNEEIEQSTDIKQDKRSSEENEKEENIKILNDENTEKYKANIQQKSRKFKDIFISFIKRDDSKKNEEIMEKNVENKKILKREKISSNELKLNKKNENEKTRTNFYSLKKKYDEDDEKSKKNIFSKKKVLSDISNDFMQNELIEKGDILNKKVIMNSESDEKIVYTSLKENTNNDNVSETNSVTKKRPNTLYNNFLESLKHPSCKEVVEKVKSFILKFPQNLSREKAASKIHNFISETQPVLLNSEIYKNLNKYQTKMIIEGYEKFIMQKLYFHLYQMDAKDKDEDEKIYTKINCLQWVELKHLEIIEEINMDRLQIAQRELLRIQKMKAPNDKLIMILNCCRIVTSVLYEAKKSYKQNKLNKKKLLSVNKEDSENNPDNIANEENKQDVVNRYIKNIVENNHINNSKKKSEVSSTINNNKESTETLNINNYEYSEENKNKNKNNNEYSDEVEHKDPANNNINNSNDHLNKGLKFSKKYLNSDTIIESDDELLPCADEVLPVLIFVIIKTNPPELISNIAFIQNFRHPSHFVSEEAYSFTQFCSGIEFIKELGKTTFLNISEEEYRENVSKAEKLYLNEVKESNKKLQEAAGKLNDLIKLSSGKKFYNNIINKIESINLNFEKIENLDSLTISNIPSFFEEYKILVNLKNDILKEVQDHFNDNFNQN